MNPKFVHNFLQDQDFTVFCTLTVGLLALSKTEHERGHENSQRNRKIDNFGLVRLSIGATDSRIFFLHLGRFYIFTRVH